MPTKPSWIENGLLLLVEWVLFFTIALCLSNSGSTILPLVWTLLANGVLLAAGVLTLRLKFKQNRMVVYYGVSLVVVLITCLIFSYPVLLSFLFTFYFLWRLFSIVEERTAEIRWWLWMLTICLSLILWLRFPSSTIHQTLIAILVIQTLLMVGFELLQVWRVSKRIGVFGTALLGLLGVMVSGFLISLFFPLIKWMLNALLYLVVMGLGYLSELLWLLLSRAMHTKAGEARLNKMLGNIKPAQNNAFNIRVGHGMNAELSMILAFIILMVISYFFIRKWRLSSTNENGVKNELPITSARITAKLKQSSRIFEILRTPKDPVRAAIFHLQKKFRKTELGRLKHETLGDWLDRLPVQSMNREAVQTIYEKVRYGHVEEVSDLDKSSFRKALEAIEDDLKRNS